MIFLPSCLFVFMSRSRAKQQDDKGEKRQHTVASGAQRRLETKRSTALSEYDSQSIREMEALSTAPMGEWPDLLEIVTHF